MFTLRNISKTDLPNLTALTLSWTRRSLNVSHSYGWLVHSDEGRPLGCLVVHHEEKTSFLQSLLVLSAYRRQKIGTLLVKAWEKQARCQGLQQLVCEFTLPLEDLLPLQNLFVQEGFILQPLTGVVFTVDPEKVKNTRFIQKTLERGTPYLPHKWRKVRYKNLTTADLHLLETSKGTLWPEYFAYDVHYLQLDLTHSFAFFKDQQVIGYITQGRLTTNAAFVPIVAAHPAYPGAGLIILKHYLFSLYLETPEINQLRCQFTSLTTVSQKLFEHLTEGRFSRKALQISLCKRLD